MDTISASLWFDGRAEEAASLYVSLLRASRIVHVLVSGGRPDFGKGCGNVPPPPYRRRVGRDREAPRRVGIATRAVAGRCPTPRIPEKTCTLTPSS